MDIPKSIKEAFQPLDGRINFFRTGLYNQPQETLRWEGCDYQSLADELLVSVNQFDKKEVFEEADRYDKLVEDTSSAIIPPRNIYYFESRLQEEVYRLLSDKESDRYFKEWKDELAAYSKCLKEIKKNTTYNPKEDYSTAQVIYLPDNFKSSDFPKTFGAKLNPKQAALLIDYLIELNISPNFDKTQIGKLAAALFGISEQNTRASSGEIYKLKKDKQCLSSLKGVLESIITAINKDISPLV